MKRIFYILAFLPLAGFGQVVVDSFRIYFQHDFELNTTGSYNYSEWGEDWNYPAWADFNSISIEQCEDADNSSKVMRCDFEEGDWGLYLGSGIQWFSELPDVYDELYFSYRLRLKEDFDPVLSGKFCGLYGFPHWGTGPPGVNDGWTAKFCWTYLDTSIYVYYYHHEQLGEYGDAFGADPGYSLDSMATRWVTMTLRIVMNTFTGEVANDDGIAEIFADSICIAHISDVIWRENPTVGIDRMHIQCFFGGGDASFAPKRAEWIKFDEFIAWEYGDGVTGLPTGNDTNAIGTKIIIPPQDYGLYIYGHRYEYYIAASYGQDPINNGNGTGQQFTIGTVSPNENHRVDSVYAYLYTTGDADTTKFYIDSLDVNGLPDGDHLYTGFIKNVDITEVTSGAGYYITMTGLDSLLVDGHYGVYALGTGATVTYWKFVYPASYEGGRQLMYNGEWTAPAGTFDVIFEIYGTPAEAAIPIYLTSYKETMFNKGYKETNYNFKQ